MQIGLYRKTVMKALDTKRAKVGLKMVARSNTRTNIALASVGLTAEVGKLLYVLNPYILGLQFTKEMREGAEYTFGQIGYHLTILSRLLNVKTPQATKNRMKMHGTRTANLLQLLNASTEVLQLFGGTFDGPPMREVDKLIVLPKQNGKKEMRKVRQVDVDADKQVQLDRMRQLRSIVAFACDLYWRLCVDIFQVAPAVFFARSARELEKRMTPPKPKPVLSAKNSIEAHPPKQAASASPLKTEEAFDHIASLAAEVHKITKSGSPYKSQKPGPKPGPKPKHPYGKPVPSKGGKAVQGKAVSAKQGSSPAEVQA